MGTVGYKVTDELKLFFSTFDLALVIFFINGVRLELFIYSLILCNILFT